MIYFGFISLIIAWGFNALMDKSSEDKFKKPWFNKTFSWPNKYRSFDSFRKNHWWYFSLYKPTYEERFPFSTTSLVFLTDGWHLFKFAFGFFLALASFFFTGLWWMPLVVKLCQWIGFNLIYNKKSL